NLRSLWLHPEKTSSELLAKELRERIITVAIVVVIIIVIVATLVLLHGIAVVWRDLRGYLYVDGCRCNTRGNGLHRVVQCDESAHAAVIEWRCRSRTSRSRCVRGFCKLVRTQ